MADPSAGWLHWWRSRRRDEKALQDEAAPVVSGLRDGDLDPLAKYLASGGSSQSPPGAVTIPRWLADEIVSMIDREEWCWFHLQTVANKRGRGWSEDLDDQDRVWRIGFFTERRRRELGKGHYESAVAEARAKFGVERTKVTDALASVRAYLDSTSKWQEQGIDIDGWQILTERFSAEIE